LDWRTEVTIVVLSPVAWGPAMAEDDDCVAAHPDFGVVCQKAGHPHLTAHWARGTVGHTSWTLFWWDREAIALDPNGKADRPPRGRTDLPPNIASTTMPP
jgi:hypothetical protein